jgi:8-oxo-dGTP diphosphatase
MPGPSALIVVAAIIRKDGKYLIAQRSEDCKSAPLKWEFPGGKVEPGEDPKDALIREIKEELGISIGNLKEFDTVMASSPRHPQIKIIAYLADWLGGELRLTGCKDAKLVDQNQFGSYDLLEADRKLAAELIRRG